MDIGATALDFSLPDMNGKAVRLKDFKGRWVVLYFYPKDETPGCTIEAIDFSALQEHFSKENAAVLGVSPDSGKSHCHFVEKHGLKVILLSDEKKEILQQYGAWGKKKFMGREYTGVLRTTFLIDPKGVIRRIWNDVKAKGHAQDVLDALIKTKQKLNRRN